MVSLGDPLALPYLSGVRIRLLELPIADMTAHQDWFFIWLARLVTCKPH
jgi:hypothetical protein